MNRLSYRRGIDKFERLHKLHAIHVWGETSTSKMSRRNQPRAPGHDHNFQIIHSSRFSYPQKCRPNAAQNTPNQQNHAKGIQVEIDTEKGNIKRIRCIEWKGYAECCPLGQKE